MPDLFDSLREQKRQRLREAGWRQVGGLCQGLPTWQTPDGKAVLTEDEALARLERDKKENPCS